MREVIEYRAVGQGKLEGGRDEGDWHEHHGKAEADRDQLHPGCYEAIYLERRTVTYGEPERVEEGDESDE